MQDNGIRFGRQLRQLEILPAHDEESVEFKEEETDRDEEE